jgi:hypothetical protein
VTKSRCPSSREYPIIARLINPQRADNADMSPCVYTASSLDVRNAANTIVQAFVDDPFNAYFYNLRRCTEGVAPGTEEMMAVHIANLLLTEWVLLVDDSGRKGAGVALWEPPRLQPLGWWKWGVKKFCSAYEVLIGLLYYRNRGVNRRVQSLRWD